MGRVSHGVNATTESSGLGAPLSSDSAVNFVVGTSAIHMLEDPSSAVNNLVIANTFAELKSALGYSENKGIDGLFTHGITEAGKYLFQIKQAGKHFFVNVADPDEHSATINNEVATFTDDVIVTAEYGALASSLILTDVGATTTYILDTDYSLSYNDTTGDLEIERIVDGSIQAGADVELNYDYIDYSLVDVADVVGGVDANGIKSGLELIDETVTSYGIPPTIILAPQYSQDPAFHVIANAKSSNIDTVFSAGLIPVDAIDPSISVPADAITWKKDNGISYPKVAIMFGFGKLGEEIYHGSTLLAGTCADVDSKQSIVNPGVSPSNNSASVNGFLDNNLAEIALDLSVLDLLNNAGINTLDNRSGSWNIWGNKTSAFPNVTDVEKIWIPTVRFFNWEQNNYILNYWSDTDKPISQNLIKNITEQQNKKYGNWVNNGVLLFGEAKFSQELNSDITLLAGQVNFEIKLTIPLPAEQNNARFSYTDAGFSLIL